MKKNQVNAIFKEQTKRRNTIISYICLISIIFIVSASFMLIYINKNKGYLVNYKEDSNIEYKVYLKENKFFDENYLDEDNKYIASLIDYINATFKYKISMEEKDVNYTYSYRIEANVNVKETNGSKPLYNKTTELLNNSDISSNGKSNVEIIENININYNEYNDLIKKFVSIYGLNDINSTLTINMYINVLGSCDEFENDTNNETVTSLVIPLTTKTVGIDIKNDLVEANDNVMICRNTTSFTIIYLILSIISLLVDIFLFVKLLKYIIDTRTAQSIYDKELKKILNYYHSYIQKVSNKIKIVDKTGLQIDSSFIYNKCQLFKLESFTDMLEIRDSLNTPILMSSNDKNTATYFLIIDAINKAVYVYGLKVLEIKKQLKKENSDNSL